MELYTVQKGKANFKPKESIWPKFGVSGFEVTGWFVPGGWASKEDYSYVNPKGDLVLDNDRQDWQKLKGLTYWLSRNNRRSLMFAFTYGDNPETYTVTAYTNDKKGGWYASGQHTLKSGEIFTGRCVMKGNYATYQFWVDGELRFTTKHDFKTMKSVREMGTFAGGANNSPGPFGGVAAKDMEIQLSFSILR